MRGGVGASSSTFNQSRPAAGDHPNRKRKEKEKKRIVFTLFLFLSATHLCANRVPDELSAHKLEAVVHRCVFVASLFLSGKKVECRKKKKSAIDDEKVLSFFPRLLCSL